MSKAKIVYNMPFDEYLSLDRLSSSALKDYIKSPLYYKYRRKKPMKETDAFKLGTMIHTWVLENQDFNKLYYPMPSLPELEKKPVKPKHLDGRRDKDHPEYLEYKNQVAIWEAKKAKNEHLTEMYTDAAKGRIVFPEDVIQHYTSKLKPYNESKNEVTLLFEINGVPCKARMDVWWEDLNGIEDIKSIANIFKVERQFVDLMYYIQAGFYAEGYKQVIGVYPSFFKFTFISTAEYFDVTTREMSFDYLELGRMKALKYVDKFKNSVEKDEWPGIGDGFLDTPPWLS